VKQNTILKEKERENDRTPISHLIMKRKKRRKKNDRHIHVKGVQFGQL
jgi:hypothetical protein